MVYVVRGDNGMTFTSCETGVSNDKEVEYANYEKAEKAKKEIQSSFKDIKLKVIEK